MEPDKHRLLFAVTFFCSCMWSCADCRNVVANPSFEFLYDWQVRERISMWEVMPADPDLLSLEEGPAHSGTMSLRLGPTNNTKSWSVFVTQYIPNVNIPKFDGRPLLKLRYWVKGSNSPLVTVHVDVVYTDSSHLFAKMPTGEVGEDEGKEDEGFVVRCSVIPAYGEIRSLGLHIALDGKADGPVHVDDVTLDLVESVDDASCPLYTDSFPKRRQVIPNFLAPTVPFTNRSISLCTQMTFDRLTSVTATSQVWNGPISLALLMLKDAKKTIKEQISELTLKYYTSKFLSAHVAFHLIMEDDLNAQDSVMYPVNFLRNIALKHASTSHVFLVDADSTPGFSERQAWEWMTKAQFLFRSSINKQCKHCAYLAPVFNVKGKDVELPVSKKQLLNALVEQKDKFEAYDGISRSMVDYGNWKKTSKPYTVDYTHNQEPFFIVPREAPLMNDLFAGYGRDLVAYSKELDRLKYTFIVLSEAFLLNHMDPWGTKTILSRSRGLSLRVFFTIELHWRDLLDGAYSTTRENYLPNQKEVVVVTNRTKCLSSSQWEREEAITRVVEKDEDDGGISCHISTFVDDLLPSARLPFVMTVRQGGPLRKDILVEKLMHEFRIGLFIEYPQSLSGMVRIYFPIMHPDAIITLLPQNEQEKYVIDGPFEVYRSPKNISEMLAEVRNLRKAPAIFSVGIEDIKEIKTEKVHEYLFAALSIATDRDVVLFQGIPPSTEVLHRDMCNLHPNWKIYHYPGSNIFVMKSASLVPNLPMEPVTPPKLVLSTEAPECDTQFTKVDVILMSRNRPVQTYAFLDSFRKFVSNVNKIWVLYRADDKIFEEAYNLAFACAGRSLTLEAVRDYQGEFGVKMLDIVKQSEAQYIVLGVDEMIWLNPVDLQYSACLLKKGEGAFYSMQLRLGESTSSFPHNEDTLRKRFFKMAHNSNVYAYFAQRLNYDYGYVLNVDGTMYSRTDFLTDMGEYLGKHKHPGDLENGWVYKKMHIHSKQWHLSYKTPNLVNNMNIDDGRMADHNKNVTQVSYDLAKSFVHDRLKIDIVKFSNANKEPTNTHINRKVEYVDLNC